MSLPTSANLSFSRINGVTRISNGNMGIGTTSPQYKLDINGNVNISGSFYQNGALLNNIVSYTSTVIYNTTQSLSITQPTDIIVSGQTGNVDLYLTSLTSGNYITVYNMGNTIGNYSMNGSSVFVKLGSATTSGSLVRLEVGDRVRIVGRNSNRTIPKGYNEIITRSSINRQMSNWFERDIPNTRNWNSVCWVQELGLFCAVNNGSAAFVMTSVDGISWTERAIPNNRNWFSVCWSSELNLFCAVNYGSAAFVMTSSDGITWTERSIPNTRNWSSICWSPELSLFCAVNYGSAAVIMTSADGVSWTERNIPNSRNWNSVCWSSELGIFCSVNYGTAAFVMTSVDGITWTERSIPTNRNWESVCWAPQLGLFCAINDNSAAVVMTSADGITWTERSIPNTRNWQSVTWAAELGLFCAVCQNVSIIMTSSDGVTWIERSIPNGRDFRSICWSSELMTFCSPVYGGSSKILTSFGLSLNLQTPTAISLGSTSSLTINTVQYTLSSYFIDYTYRGLTYTLTVNPNNSASISNGVLSVTGYYRNSTYTVTVQATNVLGRTVTSSLSVIEAAPPTPTVTSMGSTSSLTTNTVQYTLSSYFTDTTGTGLTYSLTANPQSSANISNGILSVTGNYRNTSYTVTVRATNAYGGFSSSSLSVVEANGAPIATSMGGSGTLTTNTVTRTLSSFFTNPVGVSGSITYSLVANPQSSASISAGVLSVTGNYRNASYTVTVRGTNSYGSADSSLSVTESSPPDLYSFTSQTFTNTGLVGRNGPTLSQIRTAYGGTWQQNSSYLNMTTQGIQLWTVPKDGTYRITCTGQYNNQWPWASARLTMDFALSRSQVLSIVVGQQSTTTALWAGQGASFVLLNSTVLLVAGGAGGYRLITSGIDGNFNNGAATTSITTNSTGAMYNSTIINQISAGTNGAGVDGVSLLGDQDAGRGISNMMTNPIGRLSTYSGGTSPSNYEGGFGGGGSATGAQNVFGTNSYQWWRISGGGGGYNGGNSSNYGHAGGGSSYFGSGSNASSSLTMSNASVVIQLL